MDKEIGPRIHPAPERFDSYVLMADPVALGKMEDEVYRLVMLDVNTKAIVEQVEEEGWNREFVTWLATFTDTQKRPIRTVSNEEYQKRRWAELSQEENRRFDSVTWACGLGTVVLVGLMLIPFSPFTLLFILIALATSLRFFAGLIFKWAREK